MRRVDSGALTLLLTFSILQCIAINVCPPKWIYGLYYLVLTKLTLTKWTSGSKRFLQKDHGFKIILIMQAQTNDKKMAEVTLPLLVEALNQSHYDR